MTRIVNDEVEGGQLCRRAFSSQDSSTDECLREHRPAGEDIRTNTLERSVQRGAGSQPDLAKFGAVNRKAVRNISGEQREILQAIARSRGSVD